MPRLNLSSTAWLPTSIPPPQVGQFIVASLASIIAWTQKGKLITFVNQAAASVFMLSTSVVEIPESEWILIQKSLVFRGFEDFVSLPLTPLSINMHGVSPSKAPSHFPFSLQTSKVSQPSGAGGENNPSHAPLQGPINNQVTSVSGNILKQHENIWFSGLRSEARNDRFSVIAKPHSGRDNPGIFIHEEPVGLASIPASVSTMTMSIPNLLDDPLPDDRFSVIAKPHSGRDNPGTFIHEEPVGLASIPASLSAMTMNIPSLLDDSLPFVETSFYKYSGSEGPPPSSTPSREPPPEFPLPPSLPPGEESIFTNVADQKLPKELGTLDSPPLLRKTSVVSPVASPLFSPSRSFSYSLPSEAATPADPPPPHPDSSFLSNNPTPDEEGAQHTPLTSPLNTPKQESIQPPDLVLGTISVSETTYTNKPSRLRLPKSRSLSLENLDPQDTEPSSVFSSSNKEISLALIKKSKLLQRSALTSGINSPPPDLKKQENINNVWLYRSKPMALPLLNRRILSEISIDTNVEN